MNGQPNYNAIRMKLMITCAENGGAAAFLEGGETDSAVALSLDALFLEALNIHLSFMDGGGNVVRRRMLSSQLCRLLHTSPEHEQDTQHNEAVDDSKDDTNNQFLVFSHEF